jgi:predicted transcriptional regulator
MITNTPGLHCRELARQLTIPYSTLKYHLNCLDKQGLIDTEREGKYLHYYQANTICIKERKLVCVLRKEPAKQITLFLLTNGHASQKELSKNVQKRPTTIAFYLQKLLELNIITPMIVSEGTIHTTKKQKGSDSHTSEHERRYTLTDSEYIDTLLRKYMNHLFP